MFSDFGAYLPALLVVIGWGLVNHQNNKRETRKEARALIDSVKKQATDVARQAVSYHCETKPDLAYDIKAALEQIEIELERLRDPCFHRQGPLMDAFVCFSNAITEGEFETAGAGGLLQTAPQIHRIRRTRNTLFAEVERQFRAHYL